MIVFLSNISDNQWGTSLGVQGLRLLNLLPVQRVWVQSLTGETPSNLHCSRKNPQNKKHLLGNSLLVQWLELCTLTAKGFQSLVRELRSR